MEADKEMMIKREMNRKRNRMRETEKETKREMEADKEGKTIRKMSMNRNSQ